MRCCPVCGGEFDLGKIEVLGDGIVPPDGNFVPVVGVKLSLLRLLLGAEKPLSTFEIANKLYGYSHDSPDDERNSIHVHIFQLNQTIRTHGIEIYNVVGVSGRLGKYVIRKC